jgi:hypothetical protein
MIHTATITVALTALPASLTTVTATITPLTRAVNNGIHFSLWHNLCHIGAAVLPDLAHESTQMIT